MKKKSKCINQLNVEYEGLQRPGKTKGWAVFLSEGWLSTRSKGGTGRGKMRRDPHLANIKQFYGLTEI